MVKDMEKNKITYNIKKTRVGEEQRVIPAMYYPVFFEDDEELYYVSADRKDLRVNIKKILCGAPPRRRHRGPRIPEISVERDNYVHTRIACNVPDFCDKVETLIFNIAGCYEDELFTFDAELLHSLFPNLKTVCCHDTVTIKNAESSLRILNPFAVGEYSFELAKIKDFDEANRYLRMLWALDRKWAKFWGKVARVYRQNPDYKSLGRLFAEVERLFPGTLEQMRNDNMINDDDLQKLREMMSE